MGVACWWPLTLVFQAAVSSFEGLSGISQLAKAKGKEAEKNVFFFPVNGVTLTAIVPTLWCKLEYSETLYKKI